MTPRQETWFPDRADSESSVGQIPSGGREHPASIRVVYDYLVADMQIWLMTLYDKDEVADLSPGEKRLLKAAIEEETRRRARRRGLRRT